MVDLAKDLAYVGRLLTAGLGLRGATLGAQLRGRARLLPRRVRAAALRLAEAEAMLNVPKLAIQLDHTALGRDIKTCVQYLSPLAQNRVRHGWWLRMASWAALGMMGVLAMTALLFWMRTAG